MVFQGCLKWLFEVLNFWFNWVRKISTDDAAKKLEKRDFGTPLGM